MNDEITHVDATTDVDVRDPLSAMKTMLTTINLTLDTCRWPFGDPAAPDFHYCGQPPLVGGPYCDTHNSKAYVPMRGKSSAAAINAREKKVID